ncbi:MAG: redox-sensing transcriptional repressor Rex [Acidobacteria bacterium]|nr:redox-sensing transcriptional repressor Rex [Acidobacteriota bacterium]
MKTEKISELTINRLSVYLRCLNELAEAGEQTVSSKTLAERFNLNSAQIRKDLAYFGEFGVRGVGYYVDDLRDQLVKILGLTTEHRVVIVGAGNMGYALANYTGFRPKSFTIIGVFDSDQRKVGQVVGAGLRIMHVGSLAEFIRERGVDIVILTVPAAAAEEVLELVSGAGVRAVLNFAPIQLHAPDGGKVRTVDLSISLESLSYFLANPTVDLTVD